MTHAAVEVASALTGASLLGSGIALLVGRRARLAALLLAASGASLLAGTWALAQGHDDAARALLVAGGGLLLPLSLATYPVPRYRHPVDFICLTTIGAAGVAAVAWPDPDLVQAWGLVIGLALITHTWWRIERSSGRERRALQWMALSVGSTCLVSGFATFASEYLLAFATSGLFALIGPALYVGVALPEIVDVRALVVRAVVLTVAVITYLAIFVLAAGLLEGLGAGDPSIGALGLLGALVAITFHPVQVVLRGVVDELLFGSRPDPLGAASLVASRIGDDPGSALQAIREALVLPYAALHAGDGPVVVSGTETTHVRTFDLEGIGELVVGLRPGDLGLSAGDEQVLRLTAPLLAQTLRARALTRDLLDTRGQTIAAIEEERRRLRRDLHDGLGPRLSGIAFTSDAASNLVRTDPDAAVRLLAQLRADTVTAIEDIRGLVYAMRPPALDELGLVPALRQQTVGLRTRDGAPLAVSVRAPDDLPDLPAAVEVATYRIVVEALTNISRHSASPTAAVQLAASPVGLAITVTDAGPTGAEWRAGVGMHSMRERAAELGGTLEAGPTATGGRIHAVLPLRG